MNFSAFSLVLILSVSASLGLAAPNATVHNAAGNKRPSAAQVKASSPTSSGSALRAGVSASGSGTPSPSAKGSGTRRANLTSPLSRVRRGQLTQISHFSGTGATHGVNQSKEPSPAKAPVIRGGPSASGQGPVPVPPQSGTFGRVRRSGPGSASIPQVSLKYGDGAAKTNSTSRKARSSSHGESSQEEAKSSDEETTSPPREIPSSHPLFAHRQANNLTESLRPKLRSPSQVKTEGHSQGESETETEGEGQGSSPSLHQVHQATEEEEEEGQGSKTSVISSGPVKVQGRNATLQGFASGIRKQQANRDDED